MPIGRTQDSDQFCDVFKSANGDLITGYSGHGVPLRRLLGVQLVSFNDHVDIRGPEVVLHDVSAICFATPPYRESVTSVVRRRAERAPPSAFRFLWEETGGPSVVFAEAGLARPNEYRRDGARPRKIPNRLQLGRIEMRSRASPRGRPTKEEIK